MMDKVAEWIKANPWKFAVIVLCLFIAVGGPVTYCGGYVKGCNSAQDEK